MMQVIAIIGSPNTGKSTLFNRLTSSRKALVADYAGVTRDRLYGIADIDGMPCMLIDTGGFSEKGDQITTQIHLQIEQAIIEADLCLLLVDSSQMPSSDDLQLLDMIRKKNANHMVLLNKSDIGRDKHYAEFYQYYPEFTTLSATHNRGVDLLCTAIHKQLPAVEEMKEEEEQEGDKKIRIAILGRPNVGKSTLVNQIIGEERVMALDMPGTTRDVIDIDFERKGQKFCLLDTPGVRRRARVHHFLEKFSVLKSLQAAEQSDVVIFLIDASEGLVEQDLRLIETVKKIAPALVFAINKTDSEDQEAKIKTEREVDRRDQVFVGAAPLKISALQGKGINGLLNRVSDVYQRGHRSWPTSLLNSILQKSLLVQQPAMRGRTRPRLKFVHQQGEGPPAFIIHGNQTKKLSSNYISYLHRLYREKLSLEGVCFRLIFRDAKNPYTSKDDHSGSTPARRA